MIFSGAELIRTSGQQAERSNKLQVVKESPSVGAVEASSSMGSSLERQRSETQDLKSAFSRLAQFLGHGKKEKKKTSPKETNAVRVIDVLAAYSKQAPGQPDSNVGQMLDIHV